MKIPCSYGFDVDLKNSLTDQRISKKQNLQIYDGPLFGLESKKDQLTFVKTNREYKSS